MNKAAWLAGAALTVLASPAIGQSGPPLDPRSAAQRPVPTGSVRDAPEVDIAQQGVLVFEPAFFADQRPNTALDMVVRLPGFSLSS